jgi:hypothetical protein
MIMEKYIFWTSFSCFSCQNMLVCKVLEKKSPWITDLIVVKNFQNPRGYFRLLQDRTSRTRGKTVAGTDSPVFPVGTSVNFLGIFRRSVDVTSKNFVCINHSRLFQIRAMYENLTF